MEGFRGGPAWPISARLHCFSSDIVSDSWSIIIISVLLVSALHAQSSSSLYLFNVIANMEDSEGSSASSSFRVNKYVLLEKYFCTTRFSLNDGI